MNNPLKFATVEINMFYFSINCLCAWQGGIWKSWSNRSSHSHPQPSLELIGQLHESDTLIPWKVHPIHSEQKATGAVETVYIFWRREKSPIHARNRKPVPQLSPYWLKYKKSVKDTFYQRLKRVYNIGQLTVIFKCYITKIYFFPRVWNICVKV